MNIRRDDEGMNDCRVDYSGVVEPNARICLIASAVKEIVL